MGSNFHQQKFLYGLLLFVFSISTGFASDDKLDNQKTHQVGISRTTATIEIDGKLDEAAWKDVIPSKDFIRKWPLDTGLSEVKTEVRLLYDDNFIYVSAVCYIEKPPVITTLKRDVGHWSSDGFAILLDPINQKTNGFVFGVNAGGAQTEGLVSANNPSFEWDTKWYSVAQISADKWVVEMAIPFKSLRYNKGVSSWGINFIRNDMQRNAYSTWARVPLQYRGIDLGFTGKLIWDKAPQPTKGNVVLIPFLSGGISKNQEDNENLQKNIAVGLDAKIAVTSSLNLDVTIRPDFSQVEVDQQVTNLSRFSVFFPEKRSFFLENSDIFSGFGSPPIRPFFSRQIGIQDGNSVPIKFGARLSGNVNKNVRIGVMTMQTDSIEDFSAQNYTIAAVQRQVMKRSSVKAMFINRQGYQKGEGFQTDDYNRMAALEFNYLSESGKWGGNVSYHKAFDDENVSDSEYKRAVFNHNSRKVSAFGGYINLGTNYLADVGFLRRLSNYDAEKDTSINIGYKQVFGFIEYRMYPKSAKSKLNNQGFKMWNAFIKNKDGYGFNEYVHNSAYFLRMKSGFQAEARFKYNEVNLPFVTKIIGIDTLYKQNPITMETDTIPEQYLPAKNFKYGSSEIFFRTDNRTKISFNGSLEYGTFYNGTKLSYNANLNFRQQPWGNFSLGFRRNIVKLKEGFGSADLLLINPKIEISFSEKMFWTTFFQYNTQAENFSINSRFQWRFKPMSDFFLVYTDNYGTENLNIKNRAIVFKISYWLNM